MGVAPKGASRALELKTLLREAGLRATSARAAVYECLVEAGRPLTHADVCERLREDGFDRATVYRNLADLSNANLVRRSDLGDHLWRFELAGKAEHTEEEEVHPHFVCTECGTTLCLPDGTISVQPIKGAPRVLRTGRYEVQVRGACNACV